MKSTKTKGSVDRMRCAACARSRSQHDGKVLILVWVCIVLAILAAVIAMIIDAVMR